jgi:hypothetical protein
LQLAAADPVGDPLLLWGAAEQLDIGPDAAAPAIDVGLVEIGLRSGSDIRWCGRPRIARVVVRAVPTPRGAGRSHRW